MDADGGTVLERQRGNLTHSLGGLLIQNSDGKVKVADNGTQASPVPANALAYSVSNK